MKVIINSLVVLVAIVTMISGQSTEDSYRKQEATIGTQNYTDLLRISDVLDVFNVKHIGAQWSVFEKKLNANCSKDIQEYLQALQTAEVWALKSKYFYLDGILKFLECSPLCAQIGSNVTKYVNWFTTNGHILIIETI